MFSVLKSLKKKKSSVPGDLPPRLFNNDDVKLALAEPAAIITNKVVQTGKWPDQYKVEWGTPIEKVKNPETEKQIRIISCTNQVKKH